MVMFAFRPNGRRWLAPAAALIALLTVNAPPASDVVDPRSRSSMLSRSLRDASGRNPYGTVHSEHLDGGRAQPFHVVDLGKRRHNPTASSGRTSPDSHWMASAGGTYEAPRGRVGPTGVSISTASILCVQLSSDEPTPAFSAASTGSVAPGHGCGVGRHYSCTTSLRSGRWSVEATSTPTACEMSSGKLPVAR